MPSRIIVPEDSSAYRKMDSSTYPTLEYFLEVYRDHVALQPHQTGLQAFSASPPDSHKIDAIVSSYETAIGLVEAEIRTAHPTDAAITLYQQLYQELEAFLISKGQDQRHKFVIVIPVADRPRHLQSCLQSVLTLCQTFHYGGYTNKAFPKIAVIIADDTKDQANILRHQEIARYFDAQGIETIYFGLEEQQQQLERLPQTSRNQLTSILGEVTPSVPPHKGPSVMRNITYLKLNEMCKQDKDLLFHFIDSDQEFKVTFQSDGDDKEAYVINYFYELDRIFSRQNVAILTGKVVGDPPVSPAVMAGTFLDDIITFLHRISTSKPAGACRFHDKSPQQEFAAAYHDMAELFGFKPTSEAYQYHCSLKEEHDNADCFSGFAAKLNQFFHGEHPTRKNYFNHEDPVSDVKPARTIYTGNYVFNTKGLNYFIPFARLKLRMAGPVLGRIIKSEIRNRFVSANLPMLHNRTVEDTGKSEFRPGINGEHNKIDLSGEFERQFFGDVMLFSVEKLTTMGYPQQSIDEQQIIQILESTEHEIRQQYVARQRLIVQKLELLKAVFYDDQNWWNSHNDLEPAKEQFRTFIDNIEQNFGEASPCYALIDSDTNRDRRLREMLDAMIEYTADRIAWQTILGIQQ